MRLVARNNLESMNRLVRASGAASPTYSEMGATLAGPMPAGYRHHRYRTDLGSGIEMFCRAAYGLQTWQAHRLPGVHVFPTEAVVEEGATVVVTLGTPIFAVAAPCRIISVVDEPARWGFAYGTLPGHPEEGEEAFIVSISDDESVTFEIAAFSRPGDPLVRLSGPVGRGIQRIGTTGYLRALRRFVNEGVGH